MASDRILRLSAAAFAVLFTIVVAIGYVPGWYTMVGHERKLFGLFMLMPLDDITHGITAIVGAIAAWRGAAACRLFFTAFGWYYALDAIFYLTNGFVNDLPWTADIMLNLPHVLIATAMLSLVYLRIPFGARATAPAGRVSAA